MKYEVKVKGTNGFVIIPTDGWRAAQELWASIVVEFETDGWTEIRSHTEDWTVSTMTKGDARQTVAYGPEETHMEEVEAEIAGAKAEVEESRAERLSQVEDLDARR